MIIKVGVYTLDVDVEATKKAYNTMKSTYSISNYDDGDRNFCCVLVHGRDRFIRLCEQLGVDVHYFTEMCYPILYSVENNANQYLYGGFYHIVGKILSDTSCQYIKIVEKKQKLNEAYVIEMDGISIWFVSKASNVQDCFQKPCIQMEISVINIPWVIDAPLPEQ